MLRVFIISCIIYVIFLVVTFKSPQKVGNILNIIGIISAEFEAAYYVWDGINGNITALIYTIIYLLFAVIFCLMLDIVSRQMEKYLEDQGINKKAKIKNKYVAAVLAIFLGSFGAHKFYLGKKTQGALYAMFFFTFIPGIIGIIEGVRYLTMSTDEFDLRYNLEITRNKEEVEEKLPLNVEAELVEPINNSEEEEIDNSVEDEDNTEESFKPITLDIPQINGAARVTKYDDTRYLICIQINNKKFEFLSQDNIIVSYREGNIGSYKEYGE